jgi:2-polyprenyl-3-methyl-5-hydroxy-6-metoxy-1,4-benzoquinol methylase
MTPLPLVPEYGYGTAGPNCSHPYLWPALRGMIRQLRLDPVAGTARPRLLEAGCGNGEIASRLAALGFQVSGFDASTQGIALARLAVPDGRFEVLCSGDDLGEVLGTGWDLIVSLEVIEHLYAPRRFVSELFDLLRPGGVFIVTTPYHGYLKNLALALSGRMERHFTALWDGGHIKFWSYATLTAVLLEAGFIAPALRGAGRLPWLWSSMVVAVRKPG